MTPHQWSIPVELELADNYSTLALDPSVRDKLVSPIFRGPMRSSHGCPAWVSIASAATACTRQLFMPGIMRLAVSTAQTIRSARTGATIHRRRCWRVTIARAAGKGNVLTASFALTTASAAWINSP